MGFPVGYSELLLPKVFLHLVFLLGYVRKLISWAFDAVGLGDLLDSDISSSSSPWPSEHHHHGGSGGFPEFQSVSAMLIREILPVARFEELRSEGWDLPESCAVCLYEFEAANEVRRPSNCRHVFHRCCLDRWVDHDQRTCPLCRTPLVPAELQDAFNERLWAAAGVPDSSSSFGAAFSYSSFDEDDLDYSPADDYGSSLSLLPQSLQIPPALSSLQPSY